MKNFQPYLLAALSLLLASCGEKPGNQMVDQPVSDPGPPKPEPQPGSASDIPEMLPPQVLDPGFTQAHVREALRRRARSSLKAILLDQAWFPGIGNWMADEILWRAALHPARPGGSLEGAAFTAFYKKTREVARDALQVIGTDWGEPPDTWLFNHRWKDGSTCPVAGEPLVRETIGGRTTCYCPARQSLP